MTFSNLVPTIFLNGEHTIQQYSKDGWVKEWFNRQFWRFLLGKVNLELPLVETIEYRKKLSCCEFRCPVILYLELCKMLHFLALNRIPRLDAHASKNLSLFADHWLFWSLCIIDNHQQKETILQLMVNHMQKKKQRA